MALLGILKAGGAYVPLDPAYPPARLAFIAAGRRRAGAGHRRPRRLAGRLHRRRGRRSGRPTRPAIAARPGRGPDTGPGPDDLAYVIYTSGSTGRPKGVHGHARQRRPRCSPPTRRWFGFGAGRRVDAVPLLRLRLLGLGDWGALLHGGRLVVVPYEVSPRPRRLPRGCWRDEGVTVLNQTPSAFRQLIARTTGARRAPTWRCATWCSAARRWTRARCAPWFDRHGDRTPRLVNMYGITETTVHVTYRPLDPRGRCERTRQPDRRAIPDLRAARARRAAASRCRPAGRRRAVRRRRRAGPRLPRTGRS